MKERLEEAEYSLPEQWEYEIEINSFELESIEFMSKNLVDVSKDGAVYELSVKIGVVVDLMVADYDRSPWDSEDKYFPFVLHNKLVQRYTRNASISVEISYDDGIIQNAEVISLDTEEITDLTDAKVEQISYRELDLNDDDESEM